MIKFSFIIIVFFLCTLSQIGHTRSLISSSNCIIGNQSEKSNLLTIRPMSQSCYANCNQYCLSKFKLDTETSNSGLSDDKDEIIMRSNVFNSNKDRLESCLSSCYKGKTFNTEIRIPIKIDSNSGHSIDDNGKLPYQWKCDIKSQAKTLNDLSCNYPSNDYPPDTGSICTSDQLEMAFYTTQLGFKAGDRLRVAISNLTDKTSNSDQFNQIVSTNDNNIYLCGFKTVFFSPTYFVDEGKYTGKNPTAKLFSPRDENGINTGIKVKNNDYLKVQYTGRYNSYCSKDGCKRKDGDYKIDIKIGGTKIDFDVSPYQLNDYDDLKKQQQAEICQACTESSSSSACQSPSCGFYQPHTNQQKLDVNTFWLSSPKLFKVQPVSNILETYSQFRSTILSGNILNVGNTPKDLTIEYPKASSHSYGGYFVSVEWRGCNYKNGERIQYTIVNEALYNSFNFDNYMTSSKGAKWHDLSMKHSTSGITSEIVVKSSDLQIPTDPEFGFNNDGAVVGALPGNEKDYKGRIFFKIKTLSDSEAKSLKVSEHSRSDSVGQYNLKISNITIDKGLLQSLVEEFIKKLQGISQGIFEGFQSNSHYLTIVRLVLVLYISLIGLMFMAGIAQMTQTEAVVRVFKISLVIILLSDTSFQFFNDYFFKAFSFDTVNYLANIFTPNIQMNIAPGLNPENEDCFSDAVDVKMLCVLEKDLKLFFMWDFWNRIFGLAFSGFFIGAVAITIGIIMYAVVILKITALYCVSLLALTVTLSLSPIFLPLMLFKYTKSFFDAWVKQLMSLLLQPLFIFVAISLFRVLFIVLIQSFMGNGACKMCWLEFFTVCWVEVYVPLSLGSSASFASLPMSNIGMLLALYFVGHGMYSFCTEVTTMANRMISFSLFNISSAKVGPKDMYDNAKKFGSMTYGVATAPLDVLAIDDKSMDQRKKLRKQRRDAQK